MASTLQSLIVGYAILVTAIALNILAHALDLQTWYGLFEEPTVGLVDGLFLFVIYPLSLGAAALFSHRLIQRFWP